jgi:uncharacterized protein
MSRDFPDFVDPWKAADGKRAFEGTMPLKRMHRLAPLLASTESSGDGSGTIGGDWPTEAWFMVRFGHDHEGTVIIDIEVRAELPLVCQRSLEPYLEKVSRHAELAVVKSVAEQDLLPEHYEPVQVEHGRLALLDLVEDELLLGVPQVPRNPAVGSVVVSTGEDTEAGSAERTNRPFEKLAGLLKEKSED